MINILDYNIKNIKKFLSLVLATGGLGFIGSHTCLNLIENGYDVLVIDSLINSSKVVLENIKYLVRKDKKFSGKIYFYKGDISDQNMLDNIFREQILIDNPIEAVIHFAGLKSVEESVKNPLIYWDSNLNATLKLLTIMDKYKCYKFVFSSSATVYKTNANKKLVESSIKEPHNPYGNTKQTIEKILNDLYLSNKNAWKIISLRYFNPVGAHPSGKLGENPRGKANNLFPIISQVIYGNLKKLSVFGNDWPTKDGTCVRDYIHVMDLAEAHYAALNFLNSESPQIFSINIGTGQGYSVLEIIETYSKVNKVNIPYSFDRRRNGDAAFVVADNTLASKVLNWKACKTLEDSCRDSFNYITKNKYIYS